MTGAATGGFVAGAIVSGNIEGALQGSFTAVVFAGAGDLISGGTAFGASAPVEDSLVQTAIHAVAGCVTSEVGGGKCGPGAAAAAFSKFATVNGFVGKDVVSGTITSAVIGGTASTLGGGKFANGAMTASFAYLFNAARHDTRETTWGEYRATYDLTGDPFGATDTFIGRFANTELERKVFFATTEILAGNETPYFHNEWAEYNDPKFDLPKRNALGPTPLYKIYDLGRSRLEPTRQGCALPTLLKRATRSSSSPSTTMLEHRPNRMDGPD